MAKRLRELKIASTDSDSDHSAWNKAFQNSTNASVSSMDNTCFKSTEATYTTSADELNFRRLIENDTFLRNVSENDTLQTTYRAPSIILGSGTSQGSAITNLIDSIDSTILEGAMDSDLSFYSPYETIRHINYTGPSFLNKRLPSDDEEFIDCEDSFRIPTPQSHPIMTDSILSTKYKSLPNYFSPRKHSENNNTIFKSITNESHDPDEESSTSDECNDVQSQMKHLTTILEESYQTENNPQSKRISGVKLLSIVDDLKKGPLSNLPDNKKFNDTVKYFAEILNRNSKEITVDQLTYIIHYSLKTIYNYSDRASDGESLHSSGDASRTPDFNCDNSLELDSIINELRHMYPKEKQIENESPPEWPMSEKSMAPSSVEKSILFSRTNQGRKKEYFPQPLFSNKENFTPMESSQEMRNISSSKRQVCFATKVQTSSNTNRYSTRTGKKKNVSTPHFKRNKQISEEEEEINSTTASENSFKVLERMCNNLDDNNKRSRLRRSISLTNIATEELAAYKVSATIRGKNNEGVERISRRYNNVRFQIEEPVKKYRKRRSKSLERPREFSVRVNTYSNRNDNMPSTSGVKRTTSSKKTTDDVPKIVITSDSGSIFESPIPKKNQLKTVTSNYLSPQNRRKSSGIDNSHIPAVSKLRQIFSPSNCKKGKVSSVPSKMNRTALKRTTPEKSINNTRTPPSAIWHKRLANSQDNTSQKKPWKP